MEAAGDRGWTAKPEGGGARGSVLVPVVVAMLILSLAGAALVELFGAQRISSVHLVESTQAFWAAEAGLWHAAHEGIEITTPVSFAGATYVVAKAGNTYTATATRDKVSRVVTLTSGTSGGGP